MSRIRRIAAGIALSAVALVAGCGESVMPEPQSPAAPHGPALNTTTTNLPPVPFDGTVTTQNDSTTERCTGQAGTASGRC